MLHHLDKRPGATALLSAGCIHLDSGDSTRARLGYYSHTFEPAIAIVSLVGGPRNRLARSRVKY